MELQEGLLEPPKLQTGTTMQPNQWLEHNKRNTWRIRNALIPGEDFVSASQKWNLVAAFIVQ